MFLTKSKRIARPFPVELFKRSSMRNSEQVILQPFHVPFLRFQWKEKKETASFPTCGICVHVRLTCHFVVQTVLGYRH